MEKLKNGALITYGLCFILLFVHFYVITNTDLRRGIKNRYAPKQAKQNNIALETEGKVLNRSVYHFFRQIQKNYTAKLEALTGNHKQYKAPTDFIQYGPPVGQFIPKDSPYVKTILMWTRYFSKRWFIPRTLECPRGITCVSSDNKSDLMTSDAVVFHAQNMNSTKDLPKTRLPHQRWIHFLKESPHRARINFTEFNGVYNWTITYRRDSDIPSLYSPFQKLETPWTKEQFGKEVFRIISSKSKLVASVISNCMTPHSYRLSYLDELQNHLPLDRYGRCGTLKCPRSPGCDDVMKTYKFYLAFENANCRDYLTEKVGNPLYLWDSVPVVMGSSGPREYEALLPPGSYINTEGFDSPQQLAKFLILLDRNPMLYAKYHEWRRTYTGFLEPIVPMWCRVCAMLYNTSAPVQTYTDFVGWNNQDVCIQYGDKPGMK